MREIILIRHGATAGNLERRYIGRTDEPLCTLGIEQITALKNKLPKVSKVYVSPLLRCKQSAEILFGQNSIMVDALRECDFGNFEGKNYEDLRDNTDYRKWLETDCIGQIPNGENIADFKKRCIDAFLSVAENHIAIVTHGGTIMAICEYLSGGDFHSHHINCGNYCRVFA